MGNDLFVNGKFDRAAIMRYAVAMAKKQYAESSWTWGFEMSSALMRAWQRAHALKLRAVGVVAAGGREVASWES